MDKNNYEIEGEPEVYSLIGTEFHRETDILVNTVCALEAYPQGEVVRIKDNSDKQMTIVNSLAKIESLLEEFTYDDDNLTLYSKLTNNGNEILRLDEQAVSLDDEIRGINNLEDEINALDKLANSPLVDEIKLWGETENKLNLYIRQLNNASQHIDSLMNELPNIENHELKVKKKFDFEHISAQELQEQASAIFESTIQSMTKAVAKSEVSEAINKLETLRTSSHQRLQAVADQFTGGIDADSAQAQLVERLTEKRRHLDYLRDEATKLSQIRSHIAELEGERNLLLQQYRSQQDKIYDLRNQVVEMINRNSASNVQAELIRYGDRANYRKRLDEIADNLTSTSNKIFNRQTQLDLVSEKINPERLLEIICSGDIDQLVSVAGIKDNTARVLMGMGKADIHSLELAILDDRFVIKYRKEGEEVFTPIDAGLSGGEQALALISVAMVLSFTRKSGR